MSYNLDEVSENYVLKNNESRLNDNDVTWILPNRVDFQKFILSNEFKQKSHDKKRKIISWNSNKNEFENLYSFNHQSFAANYLSKNSPYRGILLYHGLGSGKSGASISIAEGINDRKVVCLLPASLKGNYLQEIKKFGQISYNENFFWKFVEIPENKDDLNKFKEILIHKGFPEEFINDDSYISEVGNKKGVFLIDLEKQYLNTDLTEEQQKMLKNQIVKLIEYRYKLCSYNAGNHTLRLILEKIYGIDKLNDICKKKFGTENKIDWSSKSEVNKLMKYIYTNKLNPFDNKVIIIDEVHDLISTIYSGSMNGMHIYEMIMKAENLKIILLSGTPMINVPFEITILFNLLNGYIKSFIFEIEVKDYSGAKREKLENILKDFEYVDRFLIKEQQKKVILELTRIPKNFKKKITNNKYRGVVKIIKTIPDKKFIELLAIKLNKEGIGNVTKVNNRVYTLFADLLDFSYEQEFTTENINYGKRKLKFTKPLVNTKFDFKNKKMRSIIEKEFYSNYFEEDNSIKNKSQFKNRLIGLVSFYNEISGKVFSSKNKYRSEGDFEIFPKVKYENVDCTMKNYQFIAYSERREKEIELEEKSKKIMLSSENLNIGNLDQASYYRQLSRQSGNFVFPPGIERPIKSEIKKKFHEKYKNKWFKNKYDEYILELNKKYHSYFFEDNLLKLKEKNILIPDNFYSEYELIENLNIDLEEEISDKIDEELLDLKGQNLEIEREYKKKLNESINKVFDLTKNNKKNYLRIDNNQNLKGITLNYLSPKYTELFNNILKSEGLVFCYSFYIGGEGFEIFTKILEIQGMHQLEPKFINDVGLIKRDLDFKVGDCIRFHIEEDINDWKTDRIKEIKNDSLVTNNYGEIKINDAYKCHYILWTGAVNSEDRNKILKCYNNLENIYGKNLFILLASTAGAQGISLFNVRQVHIIEPYWNKVKTDQVIGRARRVKSHINLPAEKQNVSVFEYITSFSDKQKSTNWSRDNIIDDLELYKEHLLEDKDDVNTSKKIDDTIIAKIKDSSSLLQKYDNYLTSDEELKKISIKKDEVNTKILNMVKEAAIDCVGNQNDNINSNFKLANLNCYSKKLDSENFNPEDENNEYFIDTYNLFNQKSFKKTKKIIEYKIFRLSPGKSETWKCVACETINNDENINCSVCNLSQKESKEISHEDRKFSVLIKISPDANENNWQKYLGKTNKIYDYYAYNNLYINQDFEFKTMESVGTIDDDEEFYLEDDYIQNIDYFTDIESLIDQLERDNKDIRKGNNVYKFRKKILKMYNDLA